MKIWREQAGLINAEIAAKMGVTPPTICKLERNADRTNLERIIKYANACGLKEIRINTAGDARLGHTKVTKAFSVNVNWPVGQ